MEKQTIDNNVDPRISLLRCAGLHRGISFVKSRFHQTPVAQYTQATQQLSQRPEKYFSPQCDIARPDSFRLPCGIRNYTIIPQGETLFSPISHEL